MASCSSAKRAQAGEELGAEVVVAALPLHRLDDDGRHLARVGGEGRLDLGGGALLLGLDVVGDAPVEVEHDGRVVDAGPGELGEQPDLVEAGVGQAQRVARAAVEGLAEVEDHQVLHRVLEAGAAQLAGLPVEGGLEGVLHGQGAARDPEVVREAGGRGPRAEGLHEGGHLEGVDVGVGDVGGGGPEQVGLEGGVHELGVVEAHGPGGEEGEGVQVALAGQGVVHPDALGAFQVEDDGHAIGQLVLPQRLVHGIRANHSGSSLTGSRGGQGRPFPSPPSRGQDSTRSAPAGGGALPWLQSATLEGPARWRRRARAPGGPRRRPAAGRGAHDSPPAPCGALVGAAGFEPAASASRTLRAAKLRYAPAGGMISLSADGRAGVSPAAVPGAAAARRSTSRRRAKPLKGLRIQASAPDRRARKASTPRSSSSTVGGGAAPAACGRGPQVAHHRHASAGADLEVDQHHRRSRAPATGRRRLPARRRWLRW